MSDKKKHFIAELEEKILADWQKNKTFEKSVDNRKGNDHFEFYDGPPFANGLPHFGHISSSIAKDSITRYKTMQGYYVPRRFGWDCHGLPAEMKAEGDLDLGSKAEIEDYGVKNFVDYCRNSVTEFTKEWEDYIDRLGRWVDFEDNYYTMDNDYIESVMWAFKTLYDKGLAAEGFKVMPYCHICETSLSHFETRQDDSYREREDPAVTAKFPLENGLTALAWTTTPWTLVANLALAVNKHNDYAVYEGKGERLVLGEGAAERFKDELEGYTKVETIPGKDLLGLSYEPPFKYFEGHKNAHTVLHADFVNDEDGSGIAHEAPGFGEEDQTLCEAAGIEVVVPVDKHGNYTDEIKNMAGLNVFDAYEPIKDHLANQGTLFKAEMFKHMYPHCWRTDNPLIYRALSSWYIDVPKIKDELLANNQEVNWVPSNVKDGAFGQWLDGVRIWNVSRDRYWGAPIPVWKTDDGEVIVVGSIEEMKEMAVDPEKIDDLHKPSVDEIVLKTKDGKEARRVPEVFDCWFESGSMPFAQHHYPFENKDKFILPADYIVEYVGQVRGWFYTLHVLSTALFGKPAFKNVIAHGVILGTDGRKISKRLGNYPDPTEALNAYGADALRLYQFESPVMTGETVVTDEKAIVEAHRNVIMRLWNSYTFFRTYSEVDKWEAPKELKQPESSQVLDQWMLSRVNQTIEEVTAAADAYNIPKSVRPLRDLIDDMSNWFIRRSRRRFWKSEDDNDKQQAYETLWYTMNRICQLMAPWAPFISDHIYKELTKGTGLPESVHLTDWPKAESVNKEVLSTMAETREAITGGLGLRAEAKIKVRQPLSLANVTTKAELSDELSDIIKEELNVKKVEATHGEKIDVSLNTEINEELELEGIMRDIIRRVQNARKKAGLEVDDRIELDLQSEDQKVLQSIAQHSSTIKHETLAKSLSSNRGHSHTEEVKITTSVLKISLEKANG